MEKKMEATTVFGVLGFHVSLGECMSPSKPNPGTKTVSK